MTTSKTFDFLNRLTSISSVPSASSAVNFEYSYNAANQRTLRREADASYWRSDYDPLGQVTGGARYFPNNTPVAGQQFGYLFDEIGNRKQTSVAGGSTGLEPRYSRYTVNNLNQYTQRITPSYTSVMGTAHPDALVTLERVGPTIDN